MKKLAFALKYRPKRFQDVYGQNHPVQFLSNLIRRGQISRNLLLFGSVGSGKTTLARLYGRALNCESPDEQGSPCNVCDVCSITDFDRYEHYDERRRFEKIGFFEYDVPRKGGQKDDIDEFLRRCYVSPSKGQRNRILFFDEAHLVTKGGAERLLKSVEEPKPNVTFIFATTEPTRLLIALRSRLTPLEVRPLPPKLAKNFLELHAAKEGIDYEPEAMALLAGLKHGYPRDLLTGLEQLFDSDEKERVTIEKVRSVFDVDQTVVLIDYFSALGEGDFDRQIQIIDAWREPRGEIIRLIQVLLIAIYYNNILGSNATIDALIRSISDCERKVVLDRFCASFGMDNWADLRPFWRKLIEFWKISDSQLNDTAAMLRIVLFQDLVNQSIESPALERSNIPGTRSQNLTVPQHTGPAPPQEAVANFADIDGSDADADASFLRLEDVRTIINSASFLMQEYNYGFNFSVELRPELFGLHDAAEALYLIAAFCQDVEDHATRVMGCSFASMAVRQRTLTVSALIVVHVSRPETDVSVEEFMHLNTWCCEWRRNERFDPVDDALLIKVAPFDLRGALKFHWSETVKLCFGMDALLTYRGKPLHKLLGLRTVESFNSIRPPIVSVSGQLRPDHVRYACRYGMSPLSAFDMRAFDQIQSGWERSEHLDRIMLRQEREEDVERIVEKSGTEGPSFRAQMDALERLWAIPPERRPRVWPTWWQSGEV